MTAETEAKTNKQPMCSQTKRTGQHLLPTNRHYYNRNTQKSKNQPANKQNKQDRPTPATHQPTDREKILTNTQRTNRKTRQANMSD